MSYLITILLKNKPDSVDYIFTFFMLNLWNVEFQRLEDELYDFMTTVHEDNFDLEIEFTENNLKDLKVEIQNKIELDFEKQKSKKIKRLVRKQSRKMSRKVKNNIINMLNTKDTSGLEKILKDNKLPNSLVSDLMRIYRTENTIMRSKLKIDIQQELEKQGIKVKRRWLHTLSNPNTRVSSSYTPRDDHLAMNGQIENNGYFTSTTGKMTKGPGLFGLPEEDINCRCDVDFVIDN